MTLHSTKTDSSMSVRGLDGTETVVSQQGSLRSWDNPNPLWDVEQFAHYLNQKPGFIRQLIKQQRIPSVKIGGKVMLEKTTADELIAAGRRPATQPLEVDRFGHAR